MGAFSGCGGVYRSRLSHRTVPHPRRNLHASNGRSLLELDAIAARNQTARQCFEVWQATGVMPSF